MTLEVDAPRLTIIIPAFNEAIRLHARAALLHNTVETGVIDGASTEVIVVDDGSTDDTGRLAEQLLAPSFRRFRVLRLDENGGKGAAIRAGTAAAEAPIVAFMDADMAVDPAQIPHLVRAIEHSEVAIGSRSISGSIVENFHVRRKYMGRAFSRLANALTDVAIRDTQCGFKAFRTPVARLLFHFMEIDGFAFDVELLHLARRFGMQIAEVPVVWRDSGGSTIRPTDPMMMALDVLRMRIAGKWPHISALEIVSSPEKYHRSQHGIPPGVVQAVGPNTPILRMPNDRSLILFPLCEPHVVRDVAICLGERVPDISVAERSIAFTDLVKLSPLALLSFSDHDASADGCAASIPGPGSILTPEPGRSAGARVHPKPSYSAGG